MTEQENRIYALGLLNQAFPDTGAFDARDIAVLAKVIPLIETDIADCLFRERFVAASTMVKSGHCRPALPSPITDMESNLK